VARTLIVIIRAQSFKQAVEFRAKLWNLPFSAEFHRTLLKLRNDLSA